MTKFSLLQDLQEREHTPNIHRPVHRPGIQYQEYELDVGGQPRTVFIPVRECEKFETTLSLCETIDNTILRQVLRDFRGILERKES